MQWMAKISRTHIIVALVGIVAFSSTLAFLKSVDEKIEVARLNEDVTAGSVIEESQFSFIEVPNDEILKEHLFTKAAIENKNFVAKSDLSKDDLLTNSNTVRLSTKTGLKSLSIGLETDRANGGDIRKGDFIDIWQTGEDSELIATNVEVRDVIHPNKRLGISTSQTITIVLAVNSSQARALSPVVGSNDVMAVLSTGSTEDSTAQLNEHSNSNEFETLKTDAGK